MVAVLDILDDHVQNVCADNATGSREKARMPKHALPEIAVAAPPRPASKSAAHVSQCRKMRFLRCFGVRYINCLTLESSGARLFRAAAWARCQVLAAASGELLFLASTAMAGGKTSQKPDTGMSAAPKAPSASRHQPMNFGT